MVEMIDPHAILSVEISDAEELKRESNAQIEKGAEEPGEPAPVGVGFFGNIYNQFKGKVKDAIDFLLRNKEGEAAGALHHKDIGDISVVYGNDSYGLAHIAKKHPEVLSDLQGTIDGMVVTSQSDNRIVLESSTHRAVISKMLGNEPTSNWLLTAYEKKNPASASSSDIETEPEGKQNGTATLQNEISQGEDSENKSDMQEGGVNSPDIPVDAKGKKLYEQAPIESTINAIYNNPDLDETEADALVAAKIAGATKRIAQLEKKKPKIGEDEDAYIAQRAKWREQLEAEQASLAYWQGVQGAVPEMRRKERARQQMEADLKEQEKRREERVESARRAEERGRNRGDYRKAMAQWDDAPTSFYEYVAQELLAGDYKMRWNDNGSTRGLGSHTTGHRSVNRRGEVVTARNEESRAMSWLIDERTGLSPEALADRLWNDYTGSYGEEMGGGSPLDVLLDVVTSMPTPQAMWGYVKGEHDARMEAERGGSEQQYSEEEIEAFERDAMYREKYGVSEEEYWAREAELEERGERREEKDRHDEVRDEEIADARAIVTEAVITSLEGSGIEVVQVSDAEAQEMLALGGVEMMAVEEAKRRADAIEGLTPITVTSNNKTKEELSEDYKNLPSVEKEGKVIEFYNSAFKKIYKEGGLFAQVVPQLDEILKQSVLAYSENDNLGGTMRPDGSTHKEHKNVESFDNYVGKVNINGSEYYVRITVQHNKSGENGTHSFFVTNVNVYKNPTESQTIPLTLRGTTNSDGIVDTKLQQFFDYANGKLKNPEFQIVYHGSRAKFDAFDHSHMGEGEGAQAYGWGTYVTEVEEVGRVYARTSPIHDKGKVYDVTSEVEEYLGVPNGAIETAEMDSEGNVFVRVSLEDEAIDAFRKYFTENPKRWKGYPFEEYGEDTFSLSVDIEDSIKQQVKAIGTAIREDENRSQLYTVEIPEDTGHNYLPWEEEVPKEVLEEIQNKLNLSNGYFHSAYPMTGERVYKALSNLLQGDKAASEFLNDIGFVGIKYPTNYMGGGNKQGQSNYVIFNEADAQITDRVEFLKTPQGVVYGWTDGKKVYLTKEGMNPETPVHEYTHLWARAMMQGNAEGWQSVKDLLRDTPVWNEVMSDANYADIRENEDAVASECLARLSGRENARRMEAEAQKMLSEANGIMEKANVVTLIERMKRALREFWDWVGTNLFDIKSFGSIDEVTDRVLWDLIENSELRIESSEAAPVEKQIIGEQGARALDKAEEATHRLDNLGRARKMERYGYPAKAIRMATGWERGGDGKWRYEIEDARVKMPTREEAVKEYQSATMREREAQNKWEAIANRVIPSLPRASKNNTPEENEAIRKRRAEANKQEKELFEQLNKARDYRMKLDNQLRDGLYVKLTEVMDPNSEVFKSYPALKDITVMIAPSGRYLGTNGYNGYYQVISNTIYINWDLGEEAMKSTLLHEVQHAIQEIEGFALGGNTQSVATRADELKAEVSRLYEMMLSTPEWGEWVRLTNRWLDHGDKSVEPRIQEIEDSGVLRAIRAEQDRLRKKYGNYRTVWQVIDNIYSMDSEVWEHLPDWFFDKYDAYRALGGEVESRNVQARMGYTPEQRRAKLLSETEDVARADQKFIMENGGVSAMGSRVEKRMAEIATHFDGKPLEGNDKAIVNAFANGTKNEVIAVNGKRITLKQGNENKAGVKHSLMRHYGTSAGNYLTEELLLIPEVIGQGERAQNGKKVSYKKDINGTVYVVTTEIRSGVEEFTNFYTNRKPISKSLFNTDEQHGTTSQSVSADKGSDNVGDVQGVNEPKGSKVVKDTNVTKEDSEEGLLFRDGGVFYSNAEVAVRSIKQDKATPEQWLAMIQKNGGLKAGEDKWLGLSEWLAEKGKRKDERGKSLVLTKQEVLDYIKSNQIKIEEVNYEQGLVEDDGIAEYIYEGFEEIYNELRDNNDLDHFELVDYAWSVYCDQSPSWIKEAIEAVAYSDGSWDLRVVDSYVYENHATEEEGVNAINSTRMSYTTEGLENKKEIALVVPSVEPYNAHDEIHFGDAGDGRAVAWVRFGETTDAEGNRVLVIDEIQSKRHQDGREKGYRDAEMKKRAEEARKAYIEADKVFNQFREKLKEKYNYSSLVQGTAEERRAGRKIWRSKFTPEEMIKYEQLHNKVMDTLVAHDNLPRQINRVPDAPFDKNWHELAMKRMLRYAAENGFDKVAWTTGAQQAERYDIGAVVDRVERDDDGVLVRTYNEDISIDFDENGKITSGRYAGNTLAEVIGKELATKIMSMGSGEVLEEDGLRLGGEGMKGFYDKMLPSFMNKYGKKWGVKVGETTMPDIGDGGLTMHSVDVTEAMKESVMEGQPMFREGEGDNSQLTAPSQDNSRLPFAGVSDAEISFANDPVAKVMGRNQRSKKQQAKFAERERKYMRNRVAELTERLGIGDRVTVIENGELRVENSQLSERKARAKGWFDTKSGRIVINLSNHTSVADVERTLLHEAVAHYGLRELFGKQFDTFLDNVFQHAEADVRAQIVELAKKHGWDFRTATEEYLAGLAEDTNFEYLERQTSFWQKIKRFFLDMLESIGWDYNGPELSDNELRYLLWRSYENMVNPGRHRSILDNSQLKIKNSQLAASPMQGSSAEQGELSQVAEPKLTIGGIDLGKVKATNNGRKVIATTRSGHTQVFKSVHKYAIDKFGAENVEYEKAKSGSIYMTIDLPNGHDVEIRFASHTPSGYSFGEIEIDAKKKGINWSAINGKVSAEVDISFNTMTSGDIKAFLDLMNEYAENGFPQEVIAELQSYRARPNEVSEALGISVDTLAEGGEVYGDGAIQQELDEIVAKAKADGTYMKAPNGKRTNLTERQWAHVRTKAFKEWFGDWEKTARIEKLKESKPIKITGNEIEASDDIKVYRENAKKHGLNLRGEYTNTDTGHVISLSKGSIKEVTSHDVSNEQLQSVAAIPQIIENSVYIDTVENADKAKHPDVVSYDYYVCGLKIGGVDYTVKAVIANSTTGERYYDHKLTEIEKGKLISLTAGIPNPGNENNQPLSNVKDKRLISILQTNSSKVVDENGEPRVVYHGTPSEFTVFDRSKNNPTTEGFYFTDKKALAQKFAGPKGKVGEYFLNIKDPVINGFDGAGATMRKSEYRDGGIFTKRQTDRYAEKGTKEIIVFEPNQIKSATDNVGSYSSDESDIRFRDGENDASVDLSGRDRAIARDAYERMVASGRYQFTEAMQDSMMGLKLLYKAILGKKMRVEEIPDFENAYVAENLMSSQNAAQQHEYFVKYMKPLLAEVYKLAGSDAKRRQELTDYMLAKHGLERNRVMAEREAKRTVEELKIKNSQLKDAELQAAYDKAFAENRGRDYSGLRRKGVWQISMKSVAFVEKRFYLCRKF